MSIKILPEDLINKIAAGEVIERPASVVKELVENAIDANASKITVEVQAAGQKLIRVFDNGSGMSKDEIKLAIERHSTSKIKQLEDLFNITSLGFRGEALPSIASVSNLEISSAKSGGKTGSLLGVSGGKITKHDDLGCPAGTAITVKDLFFNTPARKKFLKSPATEMGHIGEVVTKYALANPKIAFSLISDNKPLFSSSGSGKLLDTIVSVYGLDLAKQLIEVKTDKIKGYINKPNISRIARDYITFFVNGRYVKNFLLNRALEESYRTLIPNNRYPIGILFIDINPTQVDVNVHPTKREVKFVKTNEVMRAVTAAAKAALENVLEKQTTAPSGYQADNIPWEPGMAEILFPQNESSNVASPTAAPRQAEGLEAELEVTAIQPYLPIYQLKNTYIIATDTEQLVLIDQHAAQERIIYDQLSQQSSIVGHQSLLIPETIELGTKERVVVEDNLEYLKSLGFSLEEFGNNSYIIRSIPAIAIKGSAKELVADIISELQNLGKSVALETKQENIRKTIACKAAIKAGDRLSPEEMNQLIRDLFQTQNPLTCPHGRPTLLKISQDDLKKRFKR